MENVGEKIYKLREEKHISQEKLALELGVARQTVSKWELSTAQPTLENIESMCKFFGVSITYFFDENSRDCEKADIGETVLIDEQLEESVFTETGVKKETKFSTLKIVATVVGMVLLGLLVIAFGIASYVLIMPEMSGVWNGYVHIVDWVGIIVLVLCVIFVTIFITLLTLIIVKFIKNKRNKKS